MFTQISAIPFPAILLLTFLFTLFSALFLLPKCRQNGSKHKHPPGPKPLPIIGNLHMLGKLPHRSLQSLAKIHGPIMSLKLGQVPTIVASSPEAAELFMKTHDAVFANRPKIQASDHFSYGSKGMVFSEYGPYWRNMKKLCTTQLLSASKVANFAPLRKEELGLLVESLVEAAAAREVVDVSEKVAKLVESIVYKMVLGQSKDDRFDLKGVVEEALHLVGSFNLGDYVPLVGASDLLGQVRKIKKTSKAYDQVVEHIIKDHEVSSHGDNNSKHYTDFVDILLSHMNQPAMDNQNEHKQQHIIGRTNIKAILLDMIAGAYDTSVTTIEWAMSELLRHPRAMKKLQDEIMNVVGENRQVDEADLVALNYLNMVVKETLRLYPVAPLLVPRESSQDVTINGYFIPKKTRVLVNAWAIGRDPQVWSENAEVFYPERFVNNDVDVRGKDFQLIPFGSGRRGCPGIQLGLTTIGLVLAQLVHCFNWELPFGMEAGDLDMTEKFGLAIPRSEHLLAVPTYRLLRKA